MKSNLFNWQVVQNYFIAPSGAALLTVALLTLLAEPAPAVNLTVANPSFELPVFSDGAFSSAVPFASQGGHGWHVGDATGFYNPPALDYINAGGNGTPQGADGSQFGWVFGFGDYVIYQTLAGDDGILGNGDDPVFEPETVYTLTVGVGNRAVGNTYGATFGGYNIRLVAGIGADSAIVGSESDSATPPPGTFIDRTLVLDSSTVSGQYGKPLTIVLRKTIQSSTADTDFDNVRLDAISTPPPGDFDLDLYVDGEDFLTWQKGFGKTSGALVSDGNADGDGDVDGADLGAWKLNFGATSVPVATPAPEPSGIVLGLLCIGSCRLAFQRGRRGDLK